MNDRVDINPLICHGKPIIKGTRIPVSLILGALASGDSNEILLEDYPTLTQEDIAAALDYASSLSNFEEHSYTAAVS